MARNLSTTLSDLDSAITAEHNAWAAFAGYAENAHLAAKINVKHVCTQPLGSPKVAQMPHLGLVAVPVGASQCQLVPASASQCQLVPAVPAAP